MRINKSSFLISSVFFLTIIYCNTYMVWPVEFRAALYGIVSLLIVGFFLFENPKRKIVSANYLFIMMTLYFIYCCMNIVIMYESIEKLLIGLYEYIFLVSLLFFCIYGCIYVHFEKIIMFLCFFGFVVSILSICEYSMGMNFFHAKQIMSWDYYGDGVTRGTVFSTSPMECGILICIYIFSCLERWIKTNKIMYIILLVVGFCGLIATHSRGPLVSFMLSFFIFLFTYVFYKYGIRLRRFFNIFLFLGIIVSALFYSVNGNEWILSIMDFEYDPSNALRFAFWINAINIIFFDTYNFLFGIGLASTGALGLGTTSITVTESGILKRWVEGGIFMMLLYYSFIFLLLRYMVKVCKSFPREGVYILSCLICILIEDVTLQITESFNVSFMFWLLAARGFLLSKSISGR